MTTTTGTESPPLPPPPLSPRLERPRHTAFRGVCTALARTTGTDPLLWRVLAVVLAFFGGLGIVLYLVGMVAIPREGEARSLGERLLKGPDRHVTGMQVVLLALTVVGVVSLFNGNDGVLVLVVLGALLFLWTRHRADAPTPAPYEPAATGSAAVAAPLRRPRSPFTGLTLSLAALVAGLLMLLGATTTSVPATVVLASALGTVGIGLVAGSWWGRSSGLILTALFLGGCLAVTAAVSPVTHAGVGDRSWTPTGSMDYRLGVGDATLDLRDLPVREADVVAVDARVDVGHLLVLVPEGVRVSLDAKADLGDLLIDGVDVNGRRVSRHAALGPSGRPQVALNLRVRTGQIEVRRG